MCANIVAGSGTALSSGDMDPMSASMDMSLGDFEQVAAVVPALTADMCEVACVSETAMTVCSVAAVAAPLTLLGLLLTRRRESYLGLLARTTGPLHVLRERRVWRGWYPLSPVSLCVWRV